MSEEDSTSETRGAVRVELFDDGGPFDSAVDAPIAVPSHSRWPVAVMGAAVVALVGGLWWAASLADDDRASVDDEGRSQVIEPDQLERGPATDIDAQPDDADVDGVLRLDTAELFVTLPADLQHVARGPRGLLASGTFDVDVSDEFSQVPALTRTSDGRVWTSGTMQNITAGSRIVGLTNQPENSQTPANEEVVVFTVGSPSGPSSELAIYSSRGGSDDVWNERNRLDVDGHIRTLSSRDGRWVATVDERAQASSSVPPMRTRLATGTIDGDSVEMLSVAPDEFVSSFAAFDDGFLAVVLRLQLSGLEADAPTPQLRRWTTDLGWEVVIDDLTLPTGPPARLIDAGENGVFLTGGGELRSVVDFRSGETDVTLSEPATYEEIDESLEPELTPALLDPGFLIVDNVVGDTSRLWISIDGSIWRRHDLASPMRGVTLLRINDGVALLSGVRDGERGVLRLEVTGPLPLDYRERTLEDGEWTSPVFTTDRLGGPGFVGLTNETGQIVLVESDDGFEIDRETPTDFPFGYFVNNMETSPAGYHVVGQLGLLEDAVFTSPNGVSWERFAMELPNSATTLQIDDFHRGTNTSAMVGSLGWADDRSRVERVILWWNADGEQARLPARPCLNLFWVCSISSLVAVDDGLLATHARDQSTGVSKWTESSGWTPVSDLDSMDLEGAVFASTGATTTWLLGKEQIWRSDDGGRSWQPAVQAPAGEIGRFIGVSGSGASAVFQADDALWFRSEQQWTAFALGSVEVRQPLAITDTSALLSGVSSDGTVIIRLAPPRPG